MPGGRNSGAVYNMYKVRFRFHINKIKILDDWFYF